MPGGAIDWKWVRKELFRHEHIAGHKKDLAAAAEEAIKLAKRLAVPRIRSRIKKISSIRDGVVAIGDTFLTAKRLTLHLGGASHLYLLLVTLGKDLEGTASRLMSEGRGLEGYLLDKAGSLAVESLAEDAEEKLCRSQARKGRSVSSRFSPGYGDWPIEEQRGLDSLLDFSKAGVGLTESLMMAPKKSISAVIGIGPAGAFDKDKRVLSCSICAMKGCVYRRARGGRL